MVDTTPEKLFWRFVRCPACHTGKFRRYPHVLVCRRCGAWYPKRNTCLELLPPCIGYRNDRSFIYTQYGKTLRLRQDRHGRKTSPELIQQKHFDWYAKNNTQGYTAYEKTPFWQSVDRITFSHWKPCVKQDAVVLDVGCAQGRSAAPFISRGANVIGFDISKVMIQMVQKRFYTQKTIRHMPYFFVGDTAHFPFQDQVFDVVILHGVLHHLAHPSFVCREISRVLKPGGIFLGLENNKTPTRWLFDVLQKLFPQWYEQAGAEPLVSRRMLFDWFSKTDLSLMCQTRVFIPPHMMNGLPKTAAYRYLRWTDTICQSLPFFRTWGGLIEIIGKKHA